MKRIKVDFNTLRYDVVCGKSPRGFGSWLFSFTNHNGFRDEFSFIGNYSDAKRSCVDFVRKIFDASNSNKNFVIVCVEI